MRVYKFLLTILLLLTLPIQCIAYNSVKDPDRVNLVMQQISLLQARLRQSQLELTDLQENYEHNLSNLVEKANKSLLDKSGLDISVSKSNLDSITIEISDSQQMISWLEKTIQEIEGQLNALNIFGVKIAHGELNNVNEMHSDLAYQKELLNVERARAKYLRDLQIITNNALAIKKEKYNRISDALKTHNLILLKQQQMRDELIYQQEQNKWLQQLNILYAKLAKVDPNKARESYTGLEREIFYTNERANFSYFQSLLARYRDQGQQIKLAMAQGNSISLLNELANQIQNINKQTERLSKGINSRVQVLNYHVSNLSQRVNKSNDLNIYISRLSSLIESYKKIQKELLEISQNVISLRKQQELALQTELASRQGLLNISPKMIIGIGKELVLIPTLTYQVVKSLGLNLIKGIAHTSIAGWIELIFLQASLLFGFNFIYKLLVLVVEMPRVGRKKMDIQWLTLQWLKRNYSDVFIVLNALCILYYFGVPLHHFLLVIYLAGVWLGIKGLLTMARLCLVETLHNTAGHDVRLYYRLRWGILIGGVITAVTVFVHQLPLIYEIKALCDWLFLFMAMVVSLLLLRSWDIIPNQILAHMETPHSYLRKSVSLICILIPLLMFANSLIGMLGYVNLIKTVSWYEGIFLLVLIGYLFVRGLISDGMEQISRLVIQYVNNGWLWTEAVLKPFDKLLQVTLLLSAGATLFLFFGWDKQSPIVERLNGLMHYQLLNVLKTTITPVNIIELVIVISIFYWTAKWTREFVYRMLVSRTKDMGVRNSIAILSQYSVVIVGMFICLRVLGIDLQALAFVASMFALGVGLGLRDLVNNFACGFLILLERPLRVGDIVNIGEFEGEVLSIGSRAITVRTWDHMEVVVPNTEIFNKSFTNWTAKDNIVRTVFAVQISRHDNPHEVKALIQTVVSAHTDILTDPASEVFLKGMSDNRMEFEVRYFVNIRNVKSRTSVTSSLLMNMWDEFGVHGIKPPYPQHEIFLRDESTRLL